MISDIAKTNFGDIKFDTKRQIRDYNVINLMLNI